MKRHAESHLDHSLTAAQIAHIFERFATRDSFFIETIELPAELGMVPCGLYGPMMGDEPITALRWDVFDGHRGTRKHLSRLVHAPSRPTRQVTVIAGPHEEKCVTCHGSGHVAGGHGFGASFPCPRDCHGGTIKHSCILYTAFGGPATPQEPGDQDCKDPEASRAFWAEHALAVEG